MKSEKRKAKSEKYDRFDMRQVILDFPKQFRIGLESAKNARCSMLGARCSNLIICGMGGSALPADILKIYLEKQNIPLPLQIHRDYGLPKQTENSLIICISYSGNTEETLSAFEEAIKNKSSVAAIASGGKLAELCGKYKIPFAEIPAGLQPRMALGFQFSALMQILINCGLVPNNASEIAALENALKPISLESRGRKMAGELKGKIPLIYSSRKFKSLARIWKIKFNENSKIPAFCNYFPELNHNEHNQFEYLSAPGVKSLRLLILQGENDHPRVLKRMKLLSQMLKPKNISIEFIGISGKNILISVFDNILLSDWVSYYLALQYKIDPTPVGLNDEFKRRLMMK